MPCLGKAETLREDDRYKWYDARHPARVEAGAGGPLHALKTEILAIVLLDLMSNETSHLREDCIRHAMVQDTYPGFVH